MAEDGFPFPEDLSGVKYLHILAISKHKLMFVYSILFVNIQTSMTTMTKNSIVTLALFEGALSECALAAKLSLLSKTIFR